LFAFLQSWPRRRNRKYLPAFCYASGSTAIEVCAAGLIARLPPGLIIGTKDRRTPVPKLMARSWTCISIPCRWDQAVPIHLTAITWSATARPHARRPKKAELRRGPRAQRKLPSSSITLACGHLRSSRYPTHDAMLTVWPSVMCVVAPLRASNRFSSDVSGHTKIEAPAIGARRVSGRHVGPQGSVTGTVTRAPLLQFEMNSPALAPRCVRGLQDDAGRTIRTIVSSLIHSAASPRCLAHYIKIEKIPRSLYECRNLACVRLWSWTFDCAVGCATLSIPSFIAESSLHLCTGTLPTINTRTCEFEDGVDFLYRTNKFVPLERHQFQLIP